MTKKKRRYEPRGFIIDSAEIEHIHGGMLDLKHIERISCVGHVR